MTKPRVKTNESSQMNQYKIFFDDLEYLKNKNDYEIQEKDKEDEIKKMILKEKEFFKKHKEITINKKNLHLR